MQIVDHLCEFCQRSYGRIYRLHRGRQLYMMEDSEGSDDEDYLRQSGKRQPTVEKVIDLAKAKRLRAVEPNSIFRHVENEFLDLEARLGPEDGFWYGEIDSD